MSESKFIKKEFVPDLSNSINAVMYFICKMDAEMAVNIIESEDLQVRDEIIFDEEDFEEAELDLLDSLKLLFKKQKAAGDTALKAYDLGIKYPNPMHYSFEGNNSGELFNYSVIILEKGIYFSVISHI